jgi:hypothetical protein
MNRRHSATAISLSVIAMVSLLIAAPASAGEPNLSATPRQLAHCVVQRVRANIAESYRDAFKACKTSFESPQPDSVPSGRSTGALTAAALPENSKP